MNYNLWMVYNISVCKLALIHRELIFHTWFMSARCLVTASLYLATLNAWHDTFTLTLHIQSICTTAILWTFEAFRGEWIPCIDPSTIYLGSYGFLARVNTSYNILNFYMKFIYDFLNHNCTPNGRSQRNQSDLPLWCMQNDKGHGSQLKENHFWSRMYVVSSFSASQTPPKWK